MAKRLLSILLLFLYLIPSIGISGSAHYCGDMVVAIVIIPTDEHPCDCKPNESNEYGCCNDKSFSIKIKDNHKSADAKIIVNNVGDLALLQNTFSIENLDAPLFQKKGQYRIKEKEPPDKRRFILYESYLI